MLRDTLGSDAYRKGFVNHAVIELARRGLARADAQVRGTSSLSMHDE
jgi:hypothetical protein